VTTETLLDEEQANEMLCFLLLCAQYFAALAMEMIRLDSLLMDASPEEEAAAGFYIPLNEVTLDSYSGDDECAAKTRFTKHQMRLIIDKLGEPHTIKVIYNHPNCYKFQVETLVIYMLRKMSTARTHVDLADSEFGGCPKRWGTGYNYIVHLFDNRFRSLIGPTGLRAWAPQFPYSLRLFASTCVTQSLELVQMDR
jgi:hypothetical protein